MRVSLRSSQRPLFDFGNYLAEGGSKVTATANVNIRDIAERYTRAGFSVLPIGTDGEKAPACERLPKDTKTRKRTWKPFQSRIADEGELQQLFGHNGQSVGVGIIGGKVSGNLEILDIDAPELVESFMQDVELVAPGLLSRLPIVETPRGEGGRHIYYRCTTEIPGNEKLASSEPRLQFDKRTGEPVVDEKTGEQRIAPDTLIETRGEGGYVVAPGSPAACHYTGRPYRHVSGPPITETPTITPDERDTLLRVARSFDEQQQDQQQNFAEVTAGKERVGLSPGDDFAARTTWSDILTPHGWTQITADYWRRPGKTSGISASTKMTSKQGNELLRVFSSNAHPFEPDKSYGKFAAYTTLNHNGDFVAAARELGKQGYGEKTALIIRSANDAPNACMALTVNESSNSLPALREELFQVGGVIEEIVAYNLRTSLYRQPVLAFAGAIALVATVIGRKIRDYNDTRPNLYLLALAPTGSGKDHARKINKKILGLANCGHLLGPEKIGSHAALINAVCVKPSLLLQVDEISRLLITAQDGARSPHLFNIVTVLLGLYSDSDTTFYSTAYADTAKEKRVEQPNSIVYGTAIPLGFWESLTKGNLTDGLLNRFLTFEAGYVSRSLRVVEPVPDSTVEWVSGWCVSDTANNLAGISPKPLVCEYEIEAGERIEEHGKVIADRRLKEDMEQAAIWSRTAEKAAKLAMIFAASRASGPEDVTVTLDDVNRAIAIANCCTRLTVYHARHSVADSPVEKVRKKVWKVVREHQPISQSELTRRTQFLRRHDRDEVIRDLIEAGEIIEVSVPTTTKPARRYTTKEP